MALSPENKQTLETLAVHESSRAVIETAYFLLDTNETSSLENGASRLILGHSEESLAINLTKSALTLSIFHTDAPLHVEDYPDKKLFLHPRAAFSVSLNMADHALPRLTSRVTAASLLNMPLLSEIKVHTGRFTEKGRPIYNFFPDEEFNTEAFEQVLYHTTAKLGLYSRAHELSQAA
jgi:hypothetical protein